MLSDALSAAIVPGWNARRRSPELAVALFVLGGVAPAAFVAWAVSLHRPWVALTIDPQFLAWGVVVGVAALVARLLALTEVWVAHGRPAPHSVGDVLAVTVALAVVVGLGYATVEAGRARGWVAPIFAGQLDTPLFDVATPLAGPPGTTPAGAPAASTVPPDNAKSRPMSAKQVARPDDPRRPSSGIDPALHGEVTTILLLGGDAGPGRWSLRTDTMMLFAVHRPTGRAALISVPRNLMGLLSPPASAMARAYPNGFGDLANAVYPVVQSRRELRDAYDHLPGIDPGVVALAEALGYSLDTTIDDYVLVDMAGFVAVVDAIGGVTVDVPRQVPMPGNIPGAPTQYPDTIGPGVIHMDGSTALGYVRSRSADSDYQRTARQRSLLAALARQVSAGDALGSYSAVVSALGASLRTSLTPDELTDVLATIGGETAIVESVGLVPPLVDVRRPDWNLMARVVAEVQVALQDGTRSGW